MKLPVVFVWSMFAQQESLRHSTCALCTARPNLSTGSSTRGAYSSATRCRQSARKRHKNNMQFQQAREVRSLAPAVLMDCKVKWKERPKPGTERSHQKSFAKSSNPH
eukprot:6472755-Amphidinium_carterae.1